MREGGDILLYQRQQEMYSNECTRNSLSQCAQTIQKRKGTNLFSQIKSNFNNTHAPIQSGICRSKGKYTKRVAGEANNKTKQNIEVTKTLLQKSKQKNKLKKSVCVCQQEASRVPSTTEKDMRVGWSHFSSLGARTSSSDSAASASMWKAPITARLSCCCCCC